MNILQAMLELKRIDAAINEKMSELSDRNMVSESVVNEQNPFDIDVSEEVSAVRKLWEDLQLLMNEKAELQARVTLANAKLGLDVLLSKRNWIRSSLKLMDNMSLRRLTYGHQKQKVAVTHIPWTANAQDKTNYWKHEVVEYAVPDAEIKEFNTLLKSQLQELEVKIAELNNQPL